LIDTIPHHGNCVGAVLDQALVRDLEVPMNKLPRFEYDHLEQLG
jgi:hypothetical protein